MKTIQIYQSADVYISRSVLFFAILLRYYSENAARHLVCKQSLLFLALCPI